MNNNLKKAVDKLKSGQYTCVFCKGDEVITCTERGVKPLLDLLDNSADLNGFSAADKVVGKAAAFLYVILGVKEIYASVMSESAVRVLAENGIVVQYDTEVKKIINRAGTGICPMEEAVYNVSNPVKALYSIRQRLSELRLRNM